MLNRLMFAGALGVVFSIVVMGLLEQPYALYITAPGALIVGWFSNDIYAYFFGSK